MKNFVKDEFSTLRKVVVAQNEFILPVKMYRPDYLPEESYEQFAAHAGKSLATAMPERQEAWEEERNTLVRVLEKHGVEVVRLRLLTEYEKPTTSTRVKATCLPGIRFSPSGI